MHSTHKLTINLSDELLAEVDDFKQSAHKPSRAAAIAELIKYALTLPPYFKEFNWKKSEKAADEDIKSGHLKSFDSVDDFLADLKE